VEPAETPKFKAIEPIPNSMEIDKAVLAASKYRGQLLAICLECYPTPQAPQRIKELQLKSLPFDLGNHLERKFAQAQFKPLISSASAGSIDQVRSSKGPRIRLKNQSPLSSKDQ
jgi:hypothetical protein